MADMEPMEAGMRDPTPPVEAAATGQRLRITAAVPLSFALQEDHTIRPRGRQRSGRLILRRAADLMCQQIARLSVRAFQMEETGRNTMEARAAFPAPVLGGITLRTGRTPGAGEDPTAGLERVQVEAETSSDSSRTAQTAIAPTSQAKAVECVLGRVAEGSSNSGQEMRTAQTGPDKMAVDSNGGQEMELGPAVQDRAVEESNGARAVEIGPTGQMMAVGRSGARIMTAFRAGPVKEAADSSGDPMATSVRFRITAPITQ